MDGEVTCEEINKLLVDFEEDTESIENLRDRIKQIKAKLQEWDPYACWGDDR